ncbi:hypothetical protein D3C87_2066440 [compost metagenome]
MVRTAAEAKGEGKKALAAWDWWCSVKSSEPSHSFLPTSLPRSLRSIFFWKSFSLIQTGIATRNELKPCGTVAR